MTKKRLRKIAVSVTAMLSFAICGFLYSCTGKREALYTIEQPESITETEESTFVSAAFATLAEETESRIFIYVCGNVTSPGVYEAAPDARVYELIEMAGGATDEGCLEALNLAEHVYDGQRLYVPDFAEYEMSGSGWALQEEVTDSALVNINTAGLELLMTLPGIGSSRAQAIIDYRDANGPFGAIEDIMQVSGIKESAFSRLKDYICVK